MSDKEPNESNFDYCERMAREISAETIVRQMFNSIEFLVSKSKTKTFQGELSKLLPYGNGIRCALERRYLGEDKE